MTPGYSHSLSDPYPLPWWPPDFAWYCPWKEERLFSNSASLPSSEHGTAFLPSRFCYSPEMIIHLKYDHKSSPDLSHKIFRTLSLHLFMITGHIPLRQRLRLKQGLKHYPHHFQPSNFKPLLWRVLQSSTSFSLPSPTSDSYPSTPSSSAPSPPLQYFSAP